MAKKRNELAEDALKLGGGLVVGGMGLSLGSSVIGSLPASAAQTGVQAGLSTAGGFFPVVATIGAAGITLKQLKKLRRTK